MFPQLTTQRFFLQQILPEDLPFIFEGLSDPVAMPYNGVYYETLEQAGAQMDWYEKNFREGTGVPWKITDKSSGVPLGVISFYYFKPEHKKAEIGFWILPAYWNQGVTSEALQAVVQYCQQVRAIHRLEAFVEEDNRASVRVLEKNGFVCEGKMRDCEMKFGKYISLLIYSLLSGE